MVKFVGVTQKLFGVTELLKFRQLTCVLWLLGALFKKQN